MKTTRLALTLAVMALFGGAGCSQSLSPATRGGVAYAGAYDEVLVDRDPHATLASNAHHLAQPLRAQK